MGNITLTLKEALLVQSVVFAEVKSIEKYLSNPDFKDTGIRKVALKHLTEYKVLLESLENKLKNEQFSRIMDKVGA